MMGTRGVTWCYNFDVPASFATSSRVRRFFQFTALLPTQMPVIPVGKFERNCAIIWVKMRTHATVSATATITLNIVTASIYSQPFFWIGMRAKCNETGLFVQVNIEFCPLATVTATSYLAIRFTCKVAVCVFQLQKKRGGGKHICRKEEKEGVRVTSYYIFILRVSYSVCQWHVWKEHGDYT